MGNGQTLTATGRAVVLLTLVLACEAHALECRNGLQRVEGTWIATPYCQDQTLAEVARQYGLKTTFAEIRSNPNAKKDVCRLLSQDIRVQTTCLDAGVPESFGGGN